MDPNWSAFPLAINSDTEESRSGITYRQWMIGQVAAGALANPSIDLNYVTGSHERKLSLVEEITDIADKLIEWEEDNP